MAKIFYVLKQDNGLFNIKMKNVRGQKVSETNIEKHDVEEIDIEETIVDIINKGKKRQDESIDDDAAVRWIERMNDINCGYTD